MKSIFCLLLTLVCQPLIAAELTISEGYLRATPPRQMMSSAYMQLTNDSAKDIIIIGGTSVMLKAIEIHNHAMVDGMMHMEHITALTIAPGESKNFSPGGLNFMLIGLKQALVAGEQFSFEISFKSGESQPITLPIKSIVN